MSFFDLPALYSQCAPAVAPSTLSAIVMHESGGQRYAIHVNGPRQLMRQPLNEAEATSTASELLGRGYSFDAGLMQINSRNFDRLRLSVDRVFDPCDNLRGGARLLTDAYLRAAGSLSSSKALFVALSVFNTGSPTAGFRNGYVTAVLNTARKQSNEFHPLIR